MKKLAIIIGGAIVMPFIILTMPIYLLVRCIQQYLEWYKED